MSGVNAHALLMQPGSVPEPRPQTALHWQRTRLHVVPAVHSLLESASYSSSSRRASFACRLGTASTSFLWGCHSLPPAVALELGLAAGSMLLEPRAAVAVQRIVLWGSLAMKGLQSQPCLAVSVQGGGQLAVSSSSRPAASGMLMTAQLALQQQQHQQQRAAVSTATIAAWLPAHPARRHAGGTAAGLAAQDGPGSFCSHPSTQQAALDLAVIRQPGAMQLAAADCLTCALGCAPLSAASTAAEASTLAASGTLAAALSGMQLREARSLATPADSLAYAVEMQVAAPAPPAACRPPPGEACCLSAGV